MLELQDNNCDTDIQDDLASVKIILTLVMDDVRISKLHWFWLNVWKNLDFELRSILPPNEFNDACNGDHS